MLEDEQTLLEKIEPLDLLYSHALDQSQFVIAPCLYYNALFFATASAMGLKNIRIKWETNRGDKIIIPNFFGISFSKSGSGKDHVFKLTTQLYSTMFEKFTHRAEAFYDARNENPSMPDKRYIKLPGYFIDVSSSEQGIQKSAQTIADMQYGSVNVISDELKH